MNTVYLKDEFREKYNRDVYTESTGLGDPGEPSSYCDEYVRYLEDRLGRVEQGPSVNVGSSVGGGSGERDAKSWEVIATSLAKWLSSQIGCPAEFSDFKWEKCKTCPQKLEEWQFKCWLQKMGEESF